MWRLKKTVVLIIMCMLSFCCFCGCNNSDSSKEVIADATDSLEQDSQTLTPTPDSTSTPIPTSTPTPTPAYVSLNERMGGKLYVGDEFTLGKYEQDNDSENGKEDIEWIVVSKEDDSYICISKYCLEYMLFNEEVRSDNIYNCWETSTIREWLNDDFYYSAFSTDEMDELSQMTTSYRGFKNWEDYKLDSFNTKDYVRLIKAGELVDAGTYPGCAKVTEYVREKMSSMNCSYYIVNDGTREHDDCATYWATMTSIVDYEPNYISDRKDYLFQLRIYDNSRLERELIEDVGASLIVYQHYDNTPYRSSTIVLPQYYSMVSNLDGVARCPSDVGGNSFCIRPVICVKLK